MLPPRRKPPDVEDAGKGQPRLARSFLRPLILGALMFTLGVDFGTNTVRALVVRSSDGAEYGSRVVEYPSGSQGVLLDPKDGLLARQHPGDYLFGLEESIRGALAEARRKPDFDPLKVVGIGLNSTGSSPIPVDARNRPLALSERWRDNLA